MFFVFYTILTQETHKHDALTHSVYVFVLIVYLLYIFTSLHSLYIRLVLCFLYNCFPHKQIPNFVSLQYFPMFSAATDDEVSIGLGSKRGLYYSFFWKRITLCVVRLRLCVD